MDHKPKRKAHNKKNKRRSSYRQSVIVPRISKISKVVGIAKLMLSPLTQQILDCRVGTNITEQNPWIFIPKEKILENLELHENSSEFLPIKEEIENFPDEKLLIGCYGHKQDEPESFMVCTTLNTVQITLNALQVQANQRHEKIIDSIEKKCGTWQPLGSDIEVNDNMSLTFRNPYQVHLTCETDNFFVRTKFTFRFVADSADGYVEILTVRQLFQNVLRKRIDSFAQCSALKTNVNTQTAIEPVINRGTIYSNILMKPRKLSKGAIENFIAQLDYKYLFDLLQTNYYMDLCREEYNFKNARHMQIFKFPLCVLSFQDIFSCRGKKVSCVSWNAMKSGIIAASYVKSLFSMIVKEETPCKPANTIFGKHLVLVWSYTNTIKPQLYLHCHREVTVVSFCSHNSNIVVGGCDNGQIAVWDISDRMERATVTKILSRKEQEHNLILSYLMDWMKNPPEVQHVYPTILSKIEESHLSPISYIEWFPPDQYITKNGKFDKCENDTHMQFLSCSRENGSINIWDIGIPKNVAAETKKRRVVRLSKLPDPLTKYESPLKALKKTFIPVFRIVASNPETRKPLTISKLLEKQSVVKYTALNSETENEIYKRTYFEFYVDNNRPIAEQKFICATAFGELRSLEWDGFDYDQGCLINSCVANVCQNKVYHDGPILVCMESPVIKNLILTIGGSVFAIWNINNLQMPIFWRKTFHRYVTGTWLTTHPFQVSLVRYDTYREIWDLMEDSKKALKINKSKGRGIAGLFSDLTRNHTKKGTFVESNIVGEIKVYSAAYKSKITMTEELQAIVNYLQYTELFKMNLQIWLVNFRNKFTKNENIEEDEIDDATQKRANRQSKIEDSTRKSSIKSALINTNKWQAKEEAFMREVLLTNKNLKLDQIVKNSDLIRQAEELRQKYAIKFAEQVNNKDKILRNWKIHLMPEQFIQKKKITVTFSKDMTHYMKQSYMQNYKDTEKQILEYISLHKFHYFYSWAELNDRVKTTWSKWTKKNLLISKEVKYKTKHNYY